MANPDQLDIRQTAAGVWRLEFDYNSDFIAFLKSRVPASDRSYDPGTHFWEVRGDNYLPALEGVAVQHFKYAQRIFRREGKLVYLNLISHQEHIQEELF